MVAVGVIEVFAGSCPVSRVPCHPFWRAQMKSTRVAVRLTMERDDEDVALRNALDPTQKGAQVKIKGMGVGALQGSSSVSADFKLHVCLYPGQNRFRHVLVK